MAFISVLVLGIAYPASVPGKIMAAWRHGSVEVLLCAYILDELRRVRPQLTPRHGLTLAEIDDFVDALSMQAEVIEPLPGVDPDLRDAQDQPVHGTLLGATWLTRQPNQQRVNLLLTWGLMLSAFAVCGLCRQPEFEADERPALWPPCHRKSRLNCNGWPGMATTRCF